MPSGWRPVRPCHSPNVRKPVLSQSPTTSPPTAKDANRATAVVRAARTILGLATMLLLGSGAYFVGAWLHSTNTKRSSPPVGPRLDIHVLDVGDGTSVLLATPSNRTLLIDAGSRTHPATEVASLLGGRRSVDLILLTGTNARCVGGFRALMNAVRVNGPVLLAGDTDDYAHAGRAARDVVAVLHERGLTAMPYDEYLLSHPNPIPGDASLQIAGLPVDTPSSRELAMAVRVEYGSSALLYAGGITAAQERDLLSHDSNLACDVLAIPSGGAQKTASPELLAQTGPQVITVSCGREHPPDEQNQRWMFASGAKVGRTDLLGSFTLHVYGATNTPVSWTYPGTPAVAKAGPTGH